MKTSFATALVAFLLLLTPGAHADVKSGVDAWNQGDYVRAVNEWRSLAASGNPDAQFNLGQAYKLGRGVPVDLPVALEWFRKAAQQGHEKAADNYGLLLYQQGRLEESMPYIKASADRGEPRAQYVYATALFNGDVAARDWVRSYALMTRASKAGVSQAKASLVEMDKHIPEAQRREGLALAGSAERREAPASRPAPKLAQAGPIPALTRPAPVATPLPVPPPAVATVAGPEARPPVTKRNPRSQPVASIQTASAKPSPSGRYRVQLGAFREQGRAPALWKKLNGRVTGLSAFQPSYVVTNGLTRLLVGPLGTSADAARLCALIKPTGTPCVVQRF